MERKRQRSRRGEPPTKIRSLVRRPFMKDKEAREASQYHAQMGLSSERCDMTPIPDALVRPKLVNLERVEPSEVIIIDVETSSPGMQAELTQLAATTLDRTLTFNQYILPEGQISPIVTSITHLAVSVQSGKKILTYKGKKVPSMILHQALISFLDWLEQLKRADHFVLIGHNSKAINMRHVIVAVKNAGLMHRFTSTVYGFGDTLPYAKAVFGKAMSCYKQQHLCKEILNLVYDAHNAENDVSSLALLCKHIMTTSSIPLKDYCWTVESLRKDIQFQKGSKERLESLEPLYLGREKGVSKHIAEKIAESGLRYGHLKCLYDRSGHDGVASVLMAQTNGRVRVTNRNAIIDSICHQLEAG